jgi:hypothetical protein
VTAADRQEQTLELEKLNRQLADWEQRRDAEAKRRLNECLSPELIFRRADQSVVDKTAFMRGLDGESPFSSRESRDVSVTVVGDRALVTLYVLATRKNDGSVRRYRNIRVFFRRDARWMLEVWFNDDVTQMEGM